MAYITDEIFTEGIMNTLVELGKYMTIEQIIELLEKELQKTQAA